MARNSLILDFVLLLLFSLALTSVYDKLQTILNWSLSGWHIYWGALLATSWSLFEQYPWVMLGNVAVMFTALLFYVWRRGGATVELLQIKKLLESIKVALERKEKNERRGVSDHFNSVL